MQVAAQSPTLSGSTRTRCCEKRIRGGGQPIGGMAYSSDQRDDGASSARRSAPSTVPNLFRERPKRAACGRLRRPSWPRVAGGAKHPTDFRNRSLRRFAHFLEEGFDRSATIANDRRKRDPLGLGETYALEYHVDDPKRFLVLPQIPKQFQFRVLLRKMDYGTNNHIPFSPRRGPLHVEQVFIEFNRSLGEAIEDHLLEQAQVTASLFHGRCVPVSSEHPAPNPRDIEISRQERSKTAFFSSSVMSLVASCLVDSTASLATNAWALARTSAPWELRMSTETTANAARPINRLHRLDLMVPFSAQNL